MKPLITITKVVYKLCMYESTTGYFNTYTYYVSDENAALYKFNCTFTDLMMQDRLSLELDSHVTNKYLLMCKDPISHSFKCCYPGAYDVISCDASELMEIVL